MRRPVLAACVAACLVVAAGCTEPNPLFCALDQDCASGVCLRALNACARCDCGGDAPVCDPATGICRACEADVECPAGARFCDPSGACQRCLDHDFAQCASGVCDRDANQCLPEDQVIYADASEGEDGLACGTLASPCQSLGGAEGAIRLLVVRPWIRLAPGEYRDAISIDVSEAKLVGAPGARISAVQDAGAPVLAIRGAADVLVDSIELANASGVEGFGVLCEGRDDRPELRLRRVTLRANAAGGLSVTDCAAVVEDSEIRDHGGPGIAAGTGGAVVARRTQVRDNEVGVEARPGSAVSLTACELAENRLAGLSASRASVVVRRSHVLGNHERGIALEDSAFELVNNIVADHLEVGVELRDGMASAARARVFEHNTVAGSGALGVACALDGGEHIARNNIVFGPDASVAGDCAHRFSVIRGGAPGPGNLSVDPRFVAPASGDYHIQAGSPCVDAGDRASEVSDDIDGDPRPQGDAPDIGADEVVARDL